ncbi:MAG TPA: glucose-1-phosphate cytidylyltransferase [Acidimicrobiales bacterium]|nr:glucose-1-phosphate cytidylyltransferase [Acidimicrobiales bacterium]
MKVVILAGGLGTRLSEETHLKPKPMVEIGGRPILWHIMKIYSAAGFNDFVVCCGYRGYAIKEYFSNYVLHNSDVSFDLKTGSAEIHRHDVEPWTVTLVDTGDATQTGGRLAKVARYLDDDHFAMTYGDSVGDVDVRKVVDFHFAQGRLATVTAILPPGRFGAIELAGSSVARFKEKPSGDDAWINGGFFVLSPDVLSYVDNELTAWEREPLERLTAEGQLSAYQHHGFWHAMDTLRDRTALEELWASGRAPWKVWE